MTDPTSELAASWQRQSAAALADLELERMPAVELLYLDAVAAHLLGPDAPVPPYTIEHGAAVVGQLLRALTDAALVPAGDLPQLEASEAMTVGRAAVVDGALRLSSRGRPGVHQLTTRLLAAVVGELEIHRADPERQVLSLYHHGLLAIASGPENQVDVTAADGLLETFAVWNEQIGQGYVPPWRLVTTG